MLGFSRARKTVRTELEWDLLVRPRPFPDRDGKLNRLEVDEISGEFVGRQVSGSIRRIEVSFAQERVSLDAALALVKQFVRNMAQVGYTIIVNQRFQGF